MCAFLVRIVSAMQFVNEENLSIWSRRLPEREQKTSYDALVDIEGRFLYRMS